MINQLFKIIILAVFIISFMSMTVSNSQECDCPSNEKEWNNYTIYPKCDKKFMECLDKLRNQYDMIKKKSENLENKKNEIDSLVHNTKNSTAQMYEILLNSYNKLVDFCKSDESKYYDEIEKYQNLLTSLEKKNKN